MRVVLLHHFPLEHDTAGSLLRQWAADLEADGHEVRLLIVDRQALPTDDSIERILCTPHDAAADLPFDVPSFGGDSAGSSFQGLTDEQLSAYRDVLRDRLDDIIAQFDPHVIHAQHVWVQGQLALETGVPYVLNAWGPELDEATAQPRYRSLAMQAAENAGRILVADAALAQRVVELFEIAPERMLVMPVEWTSQQTVDSSARRQRAAALAALYHTVYDERFGPLG